MDMQVMLSWFSVSDLAMAKDFYGRVLGLRTQFEMEGWAEFGHQQGAATVGVAQSQPGEAAAGGTVVLRVDNLERAQKELAGRGVQFEGEVQEVPGIVRLAGFRDPFGNRLQLAQVLMQG